MVNTCIQILCCSKLCWTVQTFSARRAPNGLKKYNFTFIRRFLCLRTHYHLNRLLNVLCGATPIFYSQDFYSRPRRLTATEEVEEEEENTHIQVQLTIHVHRILPLVGPINSPFYSIHPALEEYSNSSENISIGDVKGTVKCNRKKWKTIHFPIHSQRDPPLFHLLMWTLKRASVVVVLSSPDSSVSVYRDIIFDPMCGWVCLCADSLPQSLWGYLSTTSIHS